MTDVLRYEKSWWRILPLGYEGDVTVYYDSEDALPVVVGHAYSITEQGMKLALHRRVERHRRKLAHTDDVQREIVAPDGGYFPSEHQVIEGFSLYALHADGCAFDGERWNCVLGCPTRTAVESRDYDTLERLYGKDRVRRPEGA